YGFECVNLGNGRDPWPTAQLDAIERASAAICRAHGWSARSVIGHSEWSAAKIDPRGFTMPSMRTRVTTRLAAPAKPPTKPTKPTQPSKPSKPTQPTKPSNPTVPTTPRYQPFPGATFFTARPSSPVITAMGRR
ncbi:N-acetylmuramoyl-L-alanine amidase, partial [Streptomyces sp. SID8455]|nr:N-acetylmuramoyl-L-alanine amidase [Streptomyces sp. SID8455]